MDLSTGKNNVDTETLCKLEGNKGVFKGGGFRGFKPPPQNFQIFLGKVKEMR